MTAWVVFGLGADGKATTAPWTVALLAAMNHEATTDEKLVFFPRANAAPALPPCVGWTRSWPSTALSVGLRARPQANGPILRDSAFHFRITTLTDIDLSGPRGKCADGCLGIIPDGTRTRGTLNNCSTGKTPGAGLTGEENWNGYFFRSATDDAAQGNDKEHHRAQTLRPPAGGRIAPYG